MYISARFAAPSRKFWFNFRRLDLLFPLPLLSRNLEIAILTGDKRDSRRKKNNKLVSSLRQLQ